METKDKISEVALRLFNEKGTGAVTTNHIAAAAGISPGNLYYHFRNKEEIIRAIFLRMRKVIKNEVPGKTYKNLPPALEHLEAELQRTLKHKWEYRFFYRELNILINNDKELRKAFYELQKERLAVIEEMFYTFIEAGIFIPLNDSLIKLLSRSIWIIAIFWLSFIEISDEEITIDRIEESIETIRNIIKPYLTTQNSKS